MFLVVSARRSPANVVGSDVFDAEKLVGLLEIDVSEANRKRPYEWDELMMRDLRYL